MEENKMGVMEMKKLILTMSFPIMISMLIQALYNIVDSMFVARVSQDALAAVSLCYPIQMIIIAVACGTGVGINALLSRFLGEKHFERIWRRRNRIQGANESRLGMDEINPSKEQCGRKYQRQTSSRRA